MASPSAIGDTTAAPVFTKRLQYLLQDSYICSAAVVQGAPVKLNSDGTISPIAAVTDVPFGVVYSGNGGDTAALVTVITNFKAIMHGTSDAGSAAGVRVAISGYASGKTKFKTAVTTNWVSGQCLKTATDTNDIIVGLYFNPFLI